MQRHPCLGVSKLQWVSLGMGFTLPLRNCVNCRQASHHYSSSFPYLGSGTNTSCLAGWWRSQVRQKDCQVNPKADHLLAVAAAFVWGGGGAGIAGWEGKKGGFKSLVSRTNICQMFLKKFLFLIC